MPISSMIHAAETGDCASLALELSSLPATAPGRGDALEAATVGAATNGHAGCLLLLLEVGASADSRLASTGLSALMGEVLSDELDCAAILTRAGADSHLQRLAHPEFR